MIPLLPILGNRYCKRFLQMAVRTRRYGGLLMRFHGLLAHTHSIWTPKCIAWANVTRSKPV